MEEDSVKEKHPSFGILQISRCAGNPGNLFGSSIKHNNFIALRISRGTITRSLSDDWYYDDGELIEIFMSPSQFAEAITTLNMGNGVPCTIHTINNKRVEEYELQNNRQQLFDKEFKEALNELTEEYKKDIEEVKNLLDEKQSIGKADRKFILSKMYHLQNVVNSTIPFIKNQYDEAIDKTKSEAKAEIDAFLTSSVMNAGRMSLQSNENPTMVVVPQISD